MYLAMSSREVLHCNTQLLPTSVAHSRTARTCPTFNWRWLSILTGPSSRQFKFLPYLLLNYFCSLKMQQICNSYLLHTNANFIKQRLVFFEREKRDCFLYSGVLRVHWNVPPGASKLHLCQWGSTESLLLLPQNNYYSSLDWQLPRRDLVNLLHSIVTFLNKCITSFTS